MRSKPSVAKFADISTRAVDQLGLALARHRAREGLSQTAVAASAGLRQATVSKVEQGVATTQIQTIYAVCAALGTLLRNLRLNPLGIQPDSDFRISSWAGVGS